MITYQLSLDLKTNLASTTAFTRSDGWVIPFAPDNTDYQQFKKDIQNGVVLNDAEGNPITGTALTTFISTLP